MQEHVLHARLMMTHKKNGMHGATVLPERRGTTTRRKQWSHEGYGQNLGNPSMPLERLKDFGGNWY